MLFEKTEFIRSAAGEEGFPSDDRPRVVFVGRSNVGKSSTINALLGKRGFARVSSSPGKTVFVNLFLVDNTMWVVDLPGYGYSKTSKKERARYSALIEEYLMSDCNNINRMYIIVDARHKPTGDDKMMVEWVRAYGVPMTIIANKIDKLKAREVEPNLRLIRETLLLGEDDRLIPFSAEKNTNRDLLRGDIASLLDVLPQEEPLQQVESEDIVLQDE